MVDWGCGYRATTLSHLALEAQVLCAPPLYFHPSSPDVLHIKQHESPLLVKDGIMGEIFCHHLASSKPNEGFFYMPQVCDMGATALLPLRMKAEDFYALKNLTASARFEPVNSGTRG
jgi:hypothetical protein